MHAKTHRVFSNSTVGILPAGRGGVKSGIDCCAENLKG